MPMCDIKVVLNRLFGIEYLGVISTKIIEAFTEAGERGDRGRMKI